MSSNFVNCLVISSIFLLNFHQSIGQIQLHKGNWDVVKKGWPIRDQEDQSSHQFYYSSSLKLTTWTLSDLLIDLKDKLIQPLKLKLKYWQYDEEGEDLRKFQIEIDKIENEHDTYNTNFRDNWMPREYLIPSDKLEFFHLLLQSRKSMTAFKDIEVEYVTYTNDTNTPPPNLKTPGWDSYIIPPRETIMQEFVYFPDCSGGCKMEISVSTLDGYENNNIFEISVSYKYWFYGKVDIKVINGKSVTLKSTDNWESDTQTISKTDISPEKVLTIEINTEKGAFFAIKDVQIHYVLEHPNAPKEPKTIHCKSDSCNWKGIGRFFWPSLSTPLWSGSVIPIDRTLYYPTQKENEYILDEIINRKSCIKFEYWAADQSDVTLNILLKLSNEDKSDKILSIKPKLNDIKMQNSLICLQDLIAINSDFTISFNVEKSTYDNYINGFALRVLGVEPSSRTVNIKTEAQYFLHQWSDPKLYDIKSEWDTSIPNKELFTFDKRVTFKAYTESHHSASAHLISKWIHYDITPIEDLRFDIIVNSADMFQSFKVTPKICDSMMFCREGVRTGYTDHNTTLQYTHEYTYKFMKFENSKYMKLSFNIEYFKPKASNDVMFEIELKHFGDPCFVKVQEDKCPPNSECYSDPNIQLSLQKEKKDRCDCPSNLIGHIEGQAPDKFCSVENKCSRRANSDNCLPGVHGNGCEPTLAGLGYKCLCDLDSHVNWNPVSTATSAKCEEPQKKTSTVWNINPINNKYNALSDTDEAISIDFHGIDIKKNDMCLKVEYKTQSMITLHMNYTDLKRAAPKLLFNFDVNSDTQNTLDFCLSDFTSPLELEIFSVHIYVSGPTDWHKGLELSYTPYVKKLTQNKAFLSIRKVESPLNDKIASYLPTNMFRTDINSLTYIVPADKKVTKALIFSKWIDYHSSFTTNFDKNYFVYKIPLENWEIKEKKFKLSAKICTAEADLFDCYDITLSKAKDFSDNITNFHESTWKMIQINPTEKPFKVHIEITSSSDEPFDITFTSIVYGDPCGEDLSKKTALCGLHGKCISSKPMEYKCDCDPKYGGDLCDVKNSCQDPIKSNPDNGTLICSKQAQLDGEPESKCHHVSSDEFKCDCPEPYFVWKESISRCVRNAPTHETIECQNKECPVFKGDFASQFLWSHRNFPTIESIDDQMIPFYYPKTSESELTIEVKNFEEKNDLCLDFKYFATPSAQLFIKYNNRNVFTLPPSYDSKNSKTDWSPDRLSTPENICIRDLIRNPGVNFNVSFWSKFSEQNSVAIQINETNIKPKERDGPLDLQYIIQNNFTNKASTDHDFDNQFRIIFPTNIWFPTNSYEINLDDILPDQTKTAYFMSNVIKNWAEGMQLRFKISSQNGEFENFKIKVVIYDDMMNPSKQTPGIFTNSKSNGINKGFITYPIERIDTAFRFAIEITYIRVEVMGHKNENTTIFTLGPISLGDACIKSDSLMERNCNGQSKTGGCVRQGPLASDYTCNCNDEWNIPGNKDCQLQNFCVSEQPTEIIIGEHNQTRIFGKGSKFCADRYADCDPEPVGEMKFTCICKDENKFWNYEEGECSNWPKCVDLSCDLSTQKCKENNDTTKDPFCECKQGFINSNKPNELHCEKYDICKHGNPCGEDPHVLCYTLGADKHVCQCKNGYNMSTTGICISDICSYPSLHNCVHICTIKNDTKGYECSCFDGKTGNGCTLKKNCKNNVNCIDEAFCDKNDEKCTCSPGYVPKPNGGCELEKTDNILKNYCPEDRIEIISGKLSCNCSDHFIKNNDNQTCSLKAICSAGEKGRMDCESKSAKCVIDDTQIGHYKCECPAGKVFPDGDYFTNSGNINSACISVCDLHHRESNCSVISAKCNPWKLYNWKLNKPNENPSLKDYCDCLPGYYMNTTEGCVLSTYSAKLTLTIKNTFDIYLNDSEVSPALPAYYHSEAQHSNRVKRQVPSLDPEYHIDINGYYNAIVKQNELNDVLEAVAKNQLIKYDFVQKIKTKAYEVLRKLIPDIDSAEKVGIGKCKLLTNTKDFYECEIVVVLKEHFDNRTDHLKNLTDECKPITHVKRTDLCFFVQNMLVVIKDKSFNPTNNVPCQDEHSCPRMSNCKASPDGSTNYYSCECDVERFDITRTNYIKTQEIKSYKYKREECEAKQLCKDCKLQECIQSEPKFNATSNKYGFEYQCSCSHGFAEQTGQCIGVCNHQLCHHGECKQRGRDGYSCVCQDGWYGETCNNESDNSTSTSNGGWIAGIVVLAVLVVIAAAAALFFARKSRNSYKGTNASHSMDDYSGPPSRRFGEQNPTFTRD